MFHLWLPVFLSKDSNLAFNFQCFIGCFDGSILRFNVCIQRSNILWLASRSSLLDILLLLEDSLFVSYHFNEILPIEQLMLINFWDWSFGNWSLFDFLKSKFFSGDNLNSFDFKLSVLRGYKELQCPLLQISSEKPFESLDGDEIFINWTRRCCLICHRSQMHQNFFELL